MPLNRSQDACAAGDSYRRTEYRARVLGKIRTPAGIFVTVQRLAGETTSTALMP